LHQSFIASNPADVGAMIFDDDAINKYNKFNMLCMRITHRGRIYLLIDIFESLKEMQQNSYQLREKP
jgi:hypothetical protein